MPPKPPSTPVACPLFVPLVEEQWFTHPASRLIVQEYLQPLKKLDIDTVLLGCTHYPLLTALLQEELGPDITIVDSASTCAEQVVVMLNQQQHLASEREEPHHYFVSDDPEKFRALGEKIFGVALEHVEHLPS